MEIELYKSEKEKQIDRERRHYVAKSNDLIRFARNTLDLRSMRLLCVLISKIRPGDKADTEYYICVQDFAKLCGCMQNYTHIKAITTKIGRPFWMKDLFGNGEDYMISWFRHAIYNNNKGTIRFVFNETVSPFLFELKDHFTRYALEFILPMKSNYSVKLYELLKSCIEEVPLRFYWSFTIDYLQKYLGVSYERWIHFKQRVLDPAVGDINAVESIGDINIHSDLSVSYRTEKEQRKTKTVVFKVAKKSPDEIALVMQHNQWFLNGEIAKKESKLPDNQVSMEDLLEDDKFLVSPDADAVMDDDSELKAEEAEALMSFLKIKYGNTSLDITPEDSDILKSVLKDQ